MSHSEYSKHLLMATSLQWPRLLSWPCTTLYLLLTLNPPFNGLHFTMVNWFWHAQGWLFLRDSILLQIKEILPGKLYSHVAEERSGEWSDTRVSSIGLKVGNRLRFYKLSSTAIVNYQYIFSMISTIRRWMCTGECLQVYTGHTSFIYRSEIVVG